MVFPWCTLSLEPLIVPQVAFEQVLRLTHGPAPFYVFQACDSGLWSDPRPHRTWISGFKQAQQGACRVSALLSTLFPGYRAHTSQSCPATCSLPPVLLPTRPCPRYLHHDKPSDSDVLHSSKKQQTNQLP